MSRYLTFLAALAISAALLFAPTPAVAEEDLVNLSVNEMHLNAKSSSFQKLGESTGAGYPMSECSLTGNSLCGSDPYRLLGYLNAPVCQNPKLESFCIVGMSALLPSGSRIKLDARPVSSSTLPAVLSYGTPRSGSALTATISGQRVIIIVQAFYVGDLEARLDGIDTSPDNKMTPMRITASISPFKWIDWESCMKEYPQGANLYIDNENNRCAHAEEWSQDLKNTKLTLELNLPLNIPKWGFGRIQDLHVSGLESNGHFTFHLEGYPTSLNTYEAQLPRKSLISAGATWLSYGAKNLSGEGRDSMFVVDAATSLGIERPTGSSTAWKIALDTLDYGTYYWLGKTADWENFKKCSTTGSQFVGFLSTNAIAFDPTPPVTIQGSITFQAKDFHFDSDGILNTGFFNFSMTNGFARCIFKATSTPNTGAVKVEITDDKSQRVVALTTVSQDEEWIRFSASGFGYSKKVMKISFDTASKTNQLRLNGSKLSAKAREIAALKQALTKARALNPKFSKLFCLGNFPMENLKAGFAYTKSLCDSIAKQIKGLTARPNAIPAPKSSTFNNVIDFIIGN